MLQASVAQLPKMEVNRLNLFGYYVPKGAYLRLTSHGGHCLQPSPSLSATSELRLKLEYLSRAARLMYTPAHGGKSGDRSSNNLDNEQPAKLCWRDQE